jgi:hypothetical protein
MPAVSFFIDYIIFNLDNLLMLHLEVIHLGLLICQRQINLCPPVENLNALQRQSTNFHAYAD